MQQPAGPSIPGATFHAQPPVKLVLRIGRGYSALLRRVHDSPGPKEGSVEVQPVILHVRNGERSVA